MNGGERGGEKRRLARDREIKMKRATVYVSGLF